MEHLRRATIADVAKKAGVGIATVDRVINRRARVKPETAQRVLEAAEALGFRATNLIKVQLHENSKGHRLGFILQKKNALFYQHLGKILSDKAKQMNTQPVFEYLNELSPRAIVQALDRLATKVDAIALVAADHPHVNEAVEHYVRSGIPIITLITDLTTESRSGYVGLDNRLAGRTAAWTITRLSREIGKIGIIIGSHRYLCQELCEVSFRSYCRENAPDFQIVEAVISLEDPSLAQEATLDLLKRNPDLVGLYCAGGGVEGVISALREEQKHAHLITVCNEITEFTRSALIDGIVDLVISHPPVVLAEKAIELMVRAIQKQVGTQNYITLPFDIFISENV